MSDKYVVKELLARNEKQIKKIECLEFKIDSNHENQKEALNLLNEKISKSVSMKVFWFFCILVVILFFSIKGDISEL